MPSPAKILHARGKGWRFFEWVSQKILPEPCMKNSLLGCWGCFFKVFGSFGMAAIAVNGTGTYRMLRKVLFLSLYPVVIGPFNAEATLKDC